MSYSEIDENEGLLVEMNEDVSLGYARMCIKK